MKMVFNLSNDLPKLAWHAVVDTTEGVCRVHHGPWVEPFNDGFIEGVWDGPFSDFSFSSSACVFGSGAITTDDCVLFVSSASTTDCLYYLSGHGCVEISNSLPFLLASIEDELDPQCKKYHLINESITQGISKYTKQIPTKNKSITRLIHRNLKVGCKSISEIDKPLEPHFASFEAYFEYIDGRYQKIVANAVDKARNKPMAIFSTQSKGYDSTAVNAIAKKYGVDKVFTVTKGKAKGYYMGDGLHLEPDDDGTEICKFFGMNCVALDRHAIGNNEEDEYLVYATMHESGDLNLLAVTSFIDQPTVLLTGCLGEIWYTEKYYSQLPDRINSDLVRGDLGNHGMTETRLKAGYVQLAFPYIGARSRQDIFNITMSPDMAPWRLNNAYDRPIPRRIAEETGLPRHMFGQVKMASVVELPVPILPLGKALQNEFLNYLINERVLSRSKLFILPLVRRWNKVVTMTSPSRYLWNYYLYRLISRVFHKELSFAPVWSELNGMVFCFCANRLALKYRHTILHSTLEKLK